MFASVKILYHFSAQRFQNILLMHESILFLIVIPTYNRGKLIFDNLEIVANQSYRNFEIIVVDNYSTDKTDELQQTYLDKGLINFNILDRNYEGAKSRNSVMKNSGFLQHEGRLVNFDAFDLIVKHKEFIMAMLRRQSAVKENFEKYIPQFEVSFFIDAKASQLRLFRKALSLLHMTLKADFSLIFSKQFILVYEIALFRLKK